MATQPPRPPTLATPTPSSSSTTTTTFLTPAQTTTTTSSPTPPAPAPPAPPLSTTTPTPTTTAAATTTTTTTSSNNYNDNNNNDTFTFPREYHFPPFFTPQPNLTTRHSQLEKWSALVLAYCRHHRVFRLSSASPAAEALFHNRRIGRRLGLAHVREVLEFMRREGRVEFVVVDAGAAAVAALFGGYSSSSSGGGGGGGIEGAGGTGGAGGGDVVWVYWKTPEEWADLVEAWVEDTAQKGAVLTLYELTEGEGTRGTEFHGMDPEILQKALQILVKRGKAQIFGQENSQGVKFF
ncbi:ESCRT-II complex, vps25 subunit [Xylariomycetidae sp. FL2044]|nr:ESCRT-II complex, vps25 subunit [Xylariomycetidae sp. FL2044]